MSDGRPSLPTTLSGAQALIGILVVIVSVAVHVEVKSAAATSWIDQHAGLNDTLASYDKRLAIVEQQNLISVNDRNGLHTTTDTTNASVQRIEEHLAHIDEKLDALLRRIK